MRKAALFGGTFDPIHLGHTTVAQAACQQLGAEKIIFVPAKRSPLKKSGPVADDEHRLAMITLAIEDKGIFEVSDYELRRPEPSYTLQTVKHFQEVLGQDVELHWLLGADSLAELLHWYGILELIDRCRLTTMYRAGYPKPDFGKYTALLGPDRVARLQSDIVETPLVDISSTEVRRRLAAGEDVSAMLHPAVAEYIKKHNLYADE